LRGCARTAEAIPRNPVWWRFDERYWQTRGAASAWAHWMADPYPCGDCWGILLGLLGPQALPQIAGCGRREPGLEIANWCARAGRAGPWIERGLTSCPGGNCALQIVIFNFFVISVPSPFGLELLPGSSRMLRHCLADMVYIVFLSFLCRHSVW
jgi:hypothetical protein